MGRSLTANSSRKLSIAYTFRPVCDNFTRMKPLHLVALALAACSTLPDTVGEAAPDQTVFFLEEINDQEVGYTASIQFLSTGRVQGTGPCNRFNGQQTAPLPWVQIEQIAATRRGCEDMGAETGYFAALERMDFSEVGNTTLLLTNAAGESMVFRTR